MKIFAHTAKARWLGWSNDNSCIGPPPTVVYPLEMCGIQSSRNVNFCAKKLSTKTYGASRPPSPPTVTRGLNMFMCWLCVNKSMISNAALCVRQLTGKGNRSCRSNDSLKCAGEVYHTEFQTFSIIRNAPAARWLVVPRLTSISLWQRHAEHLFDTVGTLARHAHEKHRRCQKLTHGLAWPVLTIPLTKQLKIKASGPPR